ncbi:MAG: hypothetical protein JWL77_585 [Chthonomonadaceae bacterium]|nr:hypothetical protein [Chthonomonadaceae bacterium]
MAVMSLEELYERYIKPLSAEERLRLMTMTAQDLSASPDSASAPRSEISLREQFTPEFSALLEEIAPVRGLSVADLAARWIPQQAAVSSETFRESHERTEDEFRLRFADAYASGDPHAADNDQIDADLAREYGATHEDEHAA